MTSLLSKKKVVKRSPTKYKIMCISDVDLRSISNLSEWCLKNEDEIGAVDFIICVGNLTPTMEGDNENNDGNSLSPEEAAAKEGTITSMLSQLENIVCRVVFVPGEGDPKSLRTMSTLRVQGGGLPKKYDHLRLTPNARNIHKLSLPLSFNLGCCGYSEESIRVEDSDDDEDFVKSELNDADLNLIKTTKEIIEKGWQLSPSLSSTDEQGIVVTHFNQFNRTNDEGKEGTSPSLVSATFPAFDSFLSSPECQNFVLLHVSNCTPNHRGVDANVGKVKVIVPG